MISVEMYTKLLLQKRKIKQADLLRKMQELKLANDGTLIKQRLNYALNTKMSYTWARRIEIALELPDYSLVKMIGNPSPQEWKRIQSVKPMKEEEKWLN